PVSPQAAPPLPAPLSGAHRVYNGFELIEHTPIPGKEEYLDSDKYEIKTRDWNAPGNITDYITTINRLRRTHPALQQTNDLRFAQVDDPQVIGFVKESIDHGEAVAVAIALAREARHFWFHFGALEVGPPAARKRVVAIENLASGERHPVEWG